MTHWLNELGHGVNPKRVARLMKVMGLQAAMPRPHTSTPTPEPHTYPYLQRALDIDGPKPSVVRGHHLRPDAARVYPKNGG